MLAGGGLSSINPPNTGSLRPLLAGPSASRVTFALTSERDPRPSANATISGGGRGFAAQAIADVISGLGSWQLWTTLGWNEILQRYRRSLLGPFWLTASMAIMVVTLGFLYAQLFKTPIEEFLPFLCVGLLVWTLISSFLLEGGVLFTGSESYIKQVKLPYSVYVFSSTWSKLIIFAHNLVIYFAVILYFGIWPGLTGLLALPGLMLVTINGALLTLLIGMVSARFRDIPQLIASAVQIVFFVTPIMWKPELLQQRTYIATLNPVFHLIELVRAPLLGNVPSLQSYAAVLALTLVNLAVVSIFFTRFRARIAYWV